MRWPLRWYAPRRNARSHGQGLRRRGSGCHPARLPRAARAPALTLRRWRPDRCSAHSSRAALVPDAKAAHMQSQEAALLRPSPGSLVAGCAGSHAGVHLCRVRGSTCAVSGGGALAVALFARRGRRWLLRWRAPLQGARLHVCSLRRRRPGRRVARSSRAALAPTLARTSVKCEAARVQSQAEALWSSPCSLVAGCAGSPAGAHLGEVRGCTCAVTGGGALAVALFARRGLRWLRRWRAPL